MLCHTAVIKVLTMCQVPLKVFVTTKHPFQMFLDIQANSQEQLRFPVVTLMIEMPLRPLQKLPLLLNFCLDWTLSPVLYKHHPTGQGSPLIKIRNPNLNPGSFLSQTLFIAAFQKKKLNIFPAGWNFIRSQALRE